MKKAAEYREPPAADAVPAALPGPSHEADVDADAAPEWRSGRVGREQHSLRLDKLLVSLAPEFSRSHLQRLLESGHVRVDGDTAEAASRKLKLGQQVAVELVPTDESRAFRPQPMPLQVLHEDEHLLVIDKPAGLVVHPAPGHWQGTLLNGLLAHHAGAALLPRAGIVHRLDKDTSGLMLVGKTLPAVTALVRMMPGAPFTVDAPIGRDPVSRLRMAVLASGRPARTDFEPVAIGEGAVALRCTLHSGRTHQIRVHLASQGLPLVADALYGGRPALGLDRQALHAVELRLAHPISGLNLAFEGAPPPDFALAWARVQG